MARRSRLKTENNRKRKLWILFVILVFCTTIASVWVIYRTQLTNLFAIWQETFPTEKQFSDNNRGTIYDRNLKELALTLERVSLFARPREVKDLQETARVLSEVLGLPESELITRMDRDAHLVWLRRDIGQEEEDAVAALNLPGIHFHREVARSYPRREFASHLIGYSENDLGLSGVEHYYNRLLNQDRVRQEDIPAIDLKGQEQTSTNGHDLVLTLDMKIQAILEKYIAGLGEKMGSGRISSLLIETAGGEIIAGASYPSFDPNKVWQNENEALESLFFTPMVIPEEIRTFFRDAALLQGGWELGTQVYPWSLVSGKIDFSRQLRLWERLHLTTDIHVDFSDDKKYTANLPQLVNCRPPLDLGTVPNTATPLKVLLGMVHLLNGGKKIQPHILDRIMERSDQTEFYYDYFHGESKGRNVFPSLVSHELRRLLKLKGRSGVLGSTVISGETVSLRTINADAPFDRYVRDRMSLIVIPAEKPELILLIAARDEELKTDAFSYEGAEFLDKKIDTILPPIVALQQVSLNLADVVEVEKVDERNFESSPGKTGNKSDSLAGMLDRQVKVMPDLTGMSLRKGLRLLQRAEVHVAVRGTGRIASQTPKAGKTLKKGDQCVLTLKIDSVPEDAVQMNDLQSKKAY
ncbi:MAG TPA: PASTA domain-containing protein [Desulfobacterales bacterium]|nr:PASTA domain-containing protein [Desulfobacterales bacterium]HIP40733.1 PASTA domain-containing protein [Desulfocapsa sulfexigens]